ncbi:rhodanese-like domain-containing protein [Alphaproteobacteria bacterium]|nr:rhodanese-like domain-containing protein [Alphaproteobacteria bacterium]
MRVLAFYSFFEVINPIEIKQSIKNNIAKLGVEGSILLSFEGINGTILVPDEHEIFIKEYFISLGVSKYNIKVSNFNKKKIFCRFGIKIKKEIVTSGFNLTINEINKGQFIEPEKWDDFIKRDDVSIIDTRNDYEYRIGHFKNAIDPNISTFKEFKKYIEKNKNTLKENKIAIYCTGGIRCEKAGSLMHKYGIDTYQLKGGILKYLEVSGAKSWKGECFVFDKRVALNKKLQPGTSLLCHGCNMPLKSEETKSPHYKEGFSCQRCYHQLNPKKIRSLQNKRKHWKRLLGD